MTFKKLRSNQNLIVRGTVLLSVLAGSALLLGAAVFPPKGNDDPSASTIGCCPTVEIDAPVETEELDVHHAMEEIGRCFRFLNRNIDLPEQQTACLEQLATLQSMAMASRLMPPPMIEDAPAEQQASMMKEYRLILVNLMRASFDLEEAILTEDLAAADRAINAMNGVMQQGHETFIPQ